MSSLRQLLKSAFAAALPKSLLLTHGPRCAPTDEPIEIALTFDDGPHPEHTPRLLDVLADAKARGTFFVVGERAEQHPDLIRRIADEGHELGNHTWTHSEPTQTSTARFLDEIARTRRLLRDLTGRDCRLTRPPKGALTIGKALGLWRQQQTVALWNVDPKDFAMSDSAAMSQWLDSYRPQSGDIVLLHDNHPRAAVAVEQLVENHTLRFVTLSDSREPVRAISDLETTDGTRRACERIGERGGVSPPVGTISAKNRGADAAPLACASMVSQARSAPATIEREVADVR